MGCPYSLGFIEPLDEIICPQRLGHVGVSKMRLLFGALQKKKKSPTMRRPPENAKSIGLKTRAFRVLLHTTSKGHTTLALLAAGMLNPELAPPQIFISKFPFVLLERPAQMK